MGSATIHDASRLGLALFLVACSTGPRVPGDVPVGGDRVEQGVAQRVPSDVLPGLAAWKLTLPVDSRGGDSSGADSVEARNREAHEVRAEELIGYAYPPYFEVRGQEVVFRAHVAGATTRGSNYPRSELRQRVGGGDHCWSVDKRQTLEVDLRVTHVPVAKPEVCVVQIHGPVDEPLRVQVHADVGVYLVWNESHKDTANALPYALGERLQVRVVVDQGQITARIENLDRPGRAEKTWTASDRTGYFKVGCYTQSSRFLSEFKAGKVDEPLEAYGEVRVSRLALTETYP
jgi:hypothetical protein